MSSVEHAILLLAVAMVAFLIGRWRGIKDFEAEMVKRGLLKDEDS